MVTLPPEFIAINYPGYFFNTVNKELYSIKVDGVLKPLRFVKPNQYNHMRRWNPGTRGGYYVSHKGLRKLVTIETLERMAENMNLNQEIPVRVMA